MPVKYNNILAFIISLSLHTLVFYFLQKSIPSSPIDTKKDRSLPIQVKLTQPSPKLTHPRGQYMMQKKATSTPPPPVPISTPTQTPPPSTPKLYSPKVTSNTGEVKILKSEIQEIKQFTPQVYKGTTFAEYEKQRWILSLYQNGAMGFDVQKLQGMINEKWDTNIILNPVELLFWLADDVKDNSYARAQRKKRENGRFTNRWMQQTPYCYPDKTRFFLETENSARGFYRSLKMVSLPGRLPKLPSTTLYQAKKLQLCISKKERSFFKNIWKYHNEEINLRQLKKKMKRWRSRWGQILK